VVVALTTVVVVAVFEIVVVGRTGSCGNGVVTVFEIVVVVSAEFF
jgi:hypothetical protein